MKRFYNAIFILAIPVLFLVFTSGSLLHSGSPGGKTGSPGDGGELCTHCHSSTPINQQFWITSTMIATGYSPGQEYEIVVAGHDTGAQRFGFEATAEKTNNSKVGTFNAGTFGMTQTLNSGQSVTHTAAGSFPLADTATLWTFTWTAPLVSEGSITFYAVINTANGNGQTSGDQIHLSSFTATPSVGIADKLAEKEFRMYPNPSTGIVNIELNGMSEGDVIEVVNLHGQFVMKEEAANEKVSLDFTEMGKGIYFVRVGNVTGRLLIQ